MNHKEHKNIRIAGMVQGTGFRYSIKLQAEKLGLTGFVENHHDGTVYAEVEGGVAAIEKLVHWCHRGPAAARVHDVEAQHGDMKHFTGFSVH